MTNSEPKTALVVGAGLVGTLCAAMLSQRGFTVKLIEGRSDPRLSPPSARARSINLALSPRGIEALRSVSEELVDKVTKEGVRMRGRMLHVVDDAKKSDEVKRVAQDYGLYDEGEYISSISRGLLGIYLLDFVDAMKDKKENNGGSVSVLFETKLLAMDLRREVGAGVTLQTKGGEKKEEQYDLVIGGDGAYSKVRQEMMRGTR